MKVSRPLLVILLAVAVLCVVLVGAAFLPSVQRWAVLRAARQSGQDLQIGRISAGLSRFEATGVRLRADEVTVQIGRVEGDYRLWPLVTGRRLELGSLKADGIVLDAAKLDSGTAGAGAAATPAAPGALGRAELPLEIVLGQCDLTGRALLPGAAGRPPIPVEFKVTGGGIAPGKEGVLQFRATVADPVPGAVVSILRTEASLRLSQSLARTFDKVGLTALVDAEGRELAGPTQLKLTVGFAHESGKETYSVRVDTVLRGAAENLLALNATLPAAGGFYAGEWSLKARRAQIEPFLLGHKLPLFEAEGGGRFTFAVQNGHLALDGRLDAATHRWEDFDPALRPLGDISIKSSFDLAYEGELVRLNRLQATVNGIQPVLELRTMQPIAFEPATRRFRFGDAATGDVLQVKLTGVPLAWVRPFVAGLDVSGGQVTGDFSVTAEGNRLMARTVAPLQVDSLNVVQDGRALLLKAGMSADLEAVAGADGWQARLRQFRLQTPEGDRLEAQLALSAQANDSKRLLVAGSYQARLPTLLQPVLAGLQVQAEGEVDVALAGTSLNVTKLTSDVRTFEGQRMFATAVRQPFTFSTETKKITTTGGAIKELMSIELGRIALAPFLGGAPTGVSGQVAQGSFALELDGDGWLLRPVQPLLLRQFEMSEDGKPALGGVDVELAPMINFGGNGDVKVQTGDLVVKLADGTRLVGIKGEASKSSAGVLASASFQLELPALSRLPAFAGASPLAQGRAAGEVRAALDGKTEQVEARMTLNGLVGRGAAKPLPVANISLKAVRQSDGNVTVDVPVLLDRSGVRSDMNFSAALARAGAGHELKARLSGGRAELEDLLAVLAVFSSTAAETKPVPARPAALAAAPKIVADKAPAWVRLTGELALDVKAVTYGADWSMSGLNGTLRIEPTRLTLPKLEAVFGEKGRLETRGELLFTPTEQPYRLSGGLTLTGIDPGPLFKAIDPSRAPTVEGLFNVTGQIRGAGRTMDETVQRSHGEFQLTGRQGVFRGLKRGTEKVSTATRAVEFGAALGSLFGSDKVREAAEKVAGQAYFADQIAQEFGELKYDQLTVRLARDQSLDVKLNEIALISPEVRLLGKGMVTHVEGRPLLDQPLNVELALGSRGKIETLLNRARLIEGTTRDDLGYAKTRYPIVIGGTLAKPDATSYYTRLATTKLLDSLMPEN